MEETQDMIFAVQDIFSIIQTIAIIGLLIWIITCIRDVKSYFRALTLKVAEETEDLEYFDEFIGKTRIEYTESLLEMIRKVVSHVAFFEFNKFRDSHDMQKVTKSNTEVLVKDVAEKAYEALNQENVFYQDSLITQSFVESYVVELSVNMIKDLTEKTIDQIINEEGDNVMEIIR